MKRFLRIYCTAASTAVLLTTGVAWGAAGERTEKVDTVRLGERIYREGILPSGVAVQAIVKGDIPVAGSTFSCAGCHQRSGLGAVEGEIVTPAVNGAKLFEPLYYGRELTAAERTGLPAHFRSPPRRPAYTHETLAVAIRDGIGATGRELSSVMPRFDLTEQDMNALIDYLGTLSAAWSPGVTDTTIRFATVISDQVSPEARDAMLAPLESYMAFHNDKARVHEDRARYVAIAQEQDLSYRRLSLARWTLKGPPDTWRGQLEEYNRREPVFALLGGMTESDWRPVHEFSEAHGIPSILPLTDLPVISDTDWYTLYFSKGLYQEGEAVARYLAKRAGTPDCGLVVQVYRDTGEGHALAAGFRNTWQTLGKRSPHARVLPPGKPVSRDLLRQIAEHDKPAAILLWVGAEGIPAIEEAAVATTRPGTVFVSASQMKEALFTLSEAAREITAISYPHRMPQDEAAHTRAARAWLQSRNITPDGQRIATRMYSLLVVLSDIVPKMRRNYYRDYFLDLTGMVSGHEFPDYERLSFGPGQRYASKGCYIAELSRGPRPVLVRKSEWVDY